MKFTTLLSTRRTLSRAEISGGSNIRRRTCRETRDPRKKEEPHVCCAGVSRHTRWPRRAGQQNLSALTADSVLIGCCHSLHNFTHDPLLRRKWKFVVRSRERRSAWIAQIIKFVEMAVISRPRKSLTLKAGPPCSCNKCALRSQLESEVRNF